MSEVRKKHNHYHKSVKGLEYIDVYRVIRLFNVTDPCMQHALKKLLVAGGRGAGKDVHEDIQEAIDSLKRWQEMQTEDIELAQAGVASTDLERAQNRLFDVLLGDDGQAHKEGMRYMERARPDLYARLNEFKSDRNA